MFKNNKDGTAVRYFTSICYIENVLQDMITYKKTYPWCACECVRACVCVCFHECVREIRYGTARNRRNADVTINIATSNEESERTSKCNDAI